MYGAASAVVSALAAAEAFRVMSGLGARKDELPPDERPSRADGAGLVSRSSQPIGAAPVSPSMKISTG